MDERGSERRNWQTIEAKEHSIQAKDPSIDIGLHPIVEKEPIASTGDDFSPTTEHLVSTTVSASSVECTFCFVTFSWFSIEEISSSEKGKVGSKKVRLSSQKEQAVSIEE